MINLLTQCNADVYKAILDIKELSPVIGERLFDILKAHQYCWQMTFSDVMWFSAHLPRKIWDRKVHTFHLLFESQQTTQMP